MKLLCFAPVQGGSLSLNTEKFPYHGYVRLEGNEVKGMGLFLISGTTSQVEAIKSSGLVTPVTSMEPETLIAVVPVGIKPPITTLLGKSVSVKETSTKAYAEAVVATVCTPAEKLVSVSVADPEEKGNPVLNGKEIS